ncbi:MAG: pyridoxamine 5'-phosphate oxidase family protein [Eubacteriales bacterium]|nr:pyridoxamine 5'-phosphate oxidase family protein [Eubacteriales bacterium]
MSRSYEFLKDCGTFFVLTLNGNGPAGRPFGAVMEYGGKLYFSTATMKDVYRQLTGNPNIQILALKAGTRDWIRINGTAVECKELSIKERMMTEFPALKKRFESPECECFAVFEVAEKESYMSINDKFVKVD